MGNRIALTCVVLFVFGCGDGNLQIAEKIGKSENDPTILQTQRFNEDLEQLTKIAKHEEASFQFDAAARNWAQVGDMVSEKFGANAWQTRNAIIAYNSAVRNSQFNSEAELSLLRQIRQSTDQVKQYLIAGSIEAALQQSVLLNEKQAQLFGADSIEVGQVMIQIATIEHGLNHTESAIDNFHDGIRILSSHGFRNHPELEMAHAGLASLYIRKSKYSPAVANQKEATRIAGEIWGKRSLPFATQANQLGAMFHKAGNLNVALEILEQSKRIRQEGLGSDHPMFAHSCLNMGIVMMDMKKFEESVDILREALAIFEREPGPDAEITNRCRSQLATIHMLGQKPDLAEPLLRKICQSLDGSMPGNANKLLKHRYRLSVALAKQGKYELAQPIMESVLENQQKQFGLSDERTVATMKAYALLLDRTRKPESAAAVRQQLDRVAHLIESDDFQRKY